MPHYDASFRQSTMTSLRHILDLREGGVIAIVGGGGKTSLMFAIAAAVAAAGETVLTTTTTKILMPRQEESSHVIIATRTEDVLAQAKALPAGGSRHVTAAALYLAEQRKLQGFEAGEIGKLRESGLFRWILVEADGAAGRPLKAPAAHEPVIPPSSGLVIALVGLDAVGQALTEEWVFRSRLYGDLTGLLPGAAVTEESVALALTHPEGIMKGAPADAARYVFLNKADNEARRAAGLRIVNLLRKQRIMRLHRAVIGSLKGERRAWEWQDLSREDELPAESAEP